MSTYVPFHESICEGIRAHLLVISTVSNGILEIVGAISEDFRILQGSKMPARVANNIATEFQNVPTLLKKYLKSWDEDHGIRDALRDLASRTDEKQSEQ